MGKTADHRPPRYLNYEYLNSDEFAQDWSNYWPGGRPPWWTPPGGPPGDPPPVEGDPPPDEDPQPTPGPRDFYGSPWVVQQPDAGYWSSMPLPEQPNKGPGPGPVPYWPTDPYGESRLPTTPTNSYIAKIYPQMYPNSAVDYSQFVTQDQLANFAPDLSGYATTESVADQLANYNPEIDLSDYATTQSVTDQFANYDPLSGYATTESVADQLANYNPNPNPNIDLGGDAATGSVTDQNEQSVEENPELSEEDINAMGAFTPQQAATWVKSKAYLEGTSLQSTIDRYKDYFPNFDVGDQFANYNLGGDATTGSVADINAPTAAALDRLRTETPIGAALWVSQRAEYEGTSLQSVVDRYRDYFPHIGLDGFAKTGDFSSLKTPSWFRTDAERGL